jgi:hypothetical protein
VQLVRNEEELGLYRGAPVLAQYLVQLRMEACSFLYAYVVPDRGAEVIHAAYRSTAAGAENTFTVSVERTGDGRWSAHHVASAV